MPLMLPKPKNLIAGKNKNYVADVRATFSDLENTSGWRTLIDLMNEQKGELVNRVLHEIPAGDQSRVKKHNDNITTIACIEELTKWCSSIVEVCDQILEGDK